MNLKSSDISPILEKRGYTVLNQIGKGGQGFCFLVHSKYYDMDFVCKCLKKTGKRTAKLKVLEFEREVFSLAHFIHPNIVKIYDQFSEGHYLFMIIEYCPSGNLETLMVKEKLSYYAIRKIILEILSALIYLHEEKNTAHHDIKLQNILIGDNNSAKLCDFGIAQCLGSKFPQEGEEILSSDDENQEPMPEHATVKHIGGSVKYMSPQLLLTFLKKNAKFDFFSADIWAFGVSLYVLLTGDYPFHGDSMKAIYTDQLYAFDEKKVPTHALELFKTLPSDLPKDIFHVIVRCLEFSESKRATARELFDYMKQQQTKQMSSRMLIRHSNSNQIQSLPLIRKPMQKLSLSGSLSSLAKHSLANFNLPLH